MSISAMKQAYEVPLLEQLESVPADARVMYEHSKHHHENIPAGRLCHEAAAALRKAIEQAEQPESQRHISYVCPNCHWSLDRQPDHLRDATKKVWVGLDYKQMRNTTLQFNYGALWAERYLRKKNNG